MNKNQLYHWLLENGGPVIKYRTSRELIKDNEKAKKYLNELTSHPPVLTELAALEVFGPIGEADTRTFNSIHSGEGPEGILQRLYEYGLHAGIKVLDERVEVFRQYISNEHVEKAKTTPAGDDVMATRALSIASILSSRLLQLGYYFDEALNHINWQIRMLYKAAKNNSFDIYPTEEELLNYPKVPKVWKAKNVPVVKIKHYPSSQVEPLPTTKHIKAMAYYPKNQRSDDLQIKIDTIVEYISDERFQKLHEGYGIIHYKLNNTYYGWGWRPPKPCLHGYSIEDGLFSLVRFMEVYSEFPYIRDSKWFMKSMLYLDQFRTEDGTYNFDRTILKHLRMGENRRLRKTNEVESTFRMLFLKKKSGYT